MQTACGGWSCQLNDSSNQHKPGRPTKTNQLAAKEAAQVLEVALMIKQGRFAQLNAIGYTEMTALRYVMKRRRGLTGAYIGTTAIELLGSVANKTQAALRLIIEHGCPVMYSARVYQIDRRNLLKLLPQAREAAAVEAKRRSSFAEHAKVASDLSYPPALDADLPIFTPRNTTP